MPSLASLQWLEFSRDATLCNNSVTALLGGFFASNDSNGRRSPVFDGGFISGAPIGGAIFERVSMQVFLHQKVPRVA